MSSSKALKLALFTSAAIFSVTSAQAQSDYTEDEIIVTATKRASNVQDVPIAVSVVTPKVLENQGINQIGALSTVSASFNLQSSQTESQGTSIRIRGVGTTGNNIGLESAVGVFIDGVYQSRPGIALGDLVDLEAIEVLRGPQGTLFGRNTTAGALNIKSRKPNLAEFDAFGNATFGNFSQVGLQAGFNIPVVEDQLALRFSGAYRNRDGYLTSSLNDEDESLDRNRILVRGQALWEPTDAVSLRVIGDYQVSDELCCAAVTLSESPLLAAAGITNFFPALGFDDSLEDRKFNSQPFENNIDQKGISAELNWDLGLTQMTYIGAYRDFEGASRQDDFNPSLQYSINGVTFPASVEPTVDAIKTWTHELRFQGEAFNGRLDWLIGGYYADEEIEETTALALGSDFATSVSAANFGNAGILDLVSAGGNFFASGGNPANFVPISTDGAFANNQYLQDGESLSAFTHNIIAITDTIDLTLGARYVDDSKDGTYNQLEANNPACLAGLALAGALGADPAGASAALAQFGPVVQGTLTNPAVVNGGVFLNCFPFAAPALGVSFLPAEFDEEFDDEELIYTVKGAWKATPDILLFGGFTHGYKAGGFNLDSTAAAGGNDPSFASEEIDAWEFGIKSTLLDGRMRANLTFFSSTLDDFQVLEFTGTQFQTFNVDDVSSQGAELEIFARLSDYITTDIAATYTDAEYGDDCDGGGTIPQAATLCGSVLTNSPDFVGIVGLTYDGPLKDTGWGLLANVNGRYETERRTSTNPFAAVGVPIPFDFQGDNFKLNARIGLTMPNDKVSFELWGLNLTDEITRGITFNTPLQGQSRSAFINAPREYGVTVRYKY